MAVRTDLRSEKSRAVIKHLDAGFLGRRRVKLIHQTERAECGLACLAMVANYHGLDVDLATLRNRFTPSMRGVTLKTLVANADELGLLPRPVSLPLQQIVNLQTPAILHWNFNHFVVLAKINNRSATIYDPEGHCREIQVAELVKHFSGVALELSPGADFKPLRQKVQLNLSQLWSNVYGANQAIAQIIILSLVMQIFVVASPYYMQLALDSALPALDYSLLTVLAIGFALFTLISAGAIFLRDFVLLQAGNSLGLGLSVNVAKRLFKLPVPWFEKRHIGDILARFQSVHPIRHFLTEGATAALLDGVLAIFVLVVMFFYSLALSILALLAFLCYASIRLITFSLQRRANEDAIVAGGKEQSTLIESLRGMTTLRLFNKELDRHIIWQNRLVDSVNSGIRLGRLEAWQSLASNLIFGLETVVSIWLAVSFAIDGGFTVGMIFAFTAYKAQFLGRSSALVDHWISYRMLGLHLERLSDIALAKQDISFEETGSTAALKGAIELRSVCFRYSVSDPIVLDNIDLRVEAGDHIAITGQSGGGKSTLVKILLGLIVPDHGEVLIDGLPMKVFGFKNYHQQVGAVLQDDHIFTGSLADNVSFFEQAGDRERIVRACRAAAIHDEILAMPMGYDTLVGDMGSTLSGGQRQRLLLARALYREPRILILDEGTSALDSTREQLVNLAVADLGITRIIIAHRLETILSAKRVYRLQDQRLSDVTDEFDRRRDKWLGTTGAVT